MSESERYEGYLSWMFDLSFTRRDVYDLAGLFSGIKHPVDVGFFVRSADCPTCRPTLKLAEAVKEAAEVSGKGDLVKVSVYSADRDWKVFRALGVERVPSILTFGGRIRYSGVPSGEELSQFIETLIALGTGEVKLSEEVIKGVRELGKEEIKVQVLVTPTCPYCPYVAYIANLFALTSGMAGGRISSETVELYENPDIAQKYMVFSVPAIVVNGELRYVGALTEYELLELLKG